MEKKDQGKRASTQNDVLLQREPLIYFHVVKYEQGEQE